MTPSRSWPARPGAVGDTTGIVLDPPTLRSWTPGAAVAPRGRLPASWRRVARDPRARRVRPADRPHPELDGGGLADHAGGRAGPSATTDRDRGPGARAADGRRLEQGVFARVPAGHHDHDALPHPTRSSRVAPTPRWSPRRRSATGVNARPRPDRRRWRARGAAGLEAAVEVVEAFVCEPLWPARMRAPRSMRSGSPGSPDTTSERVFEKLAFGGRTEGVAAICGSRTSRSSGSRSRRTRSSSSSRASRSRATSGRHSDPPMAPAQMPHRGVAADRPLQPERDPRERGHGLSVPLAAAPSAEVRRLAARARAAHGRRRAWTRHDRTRRPISGPVAHRAGRGGGRGSTTTWRDRDVESVGIPMRGDRRQPQRVDQRRRAALRGETATRPQGRKARD